MKRNSSRESTAAPSRVHLILYILGALLALGGIAEATYLAALHFAGADVVCIASATCSQVLQSKYATIGRVPLSVLGGLAYFFVFSCAVLAAFGYRRAHTFFAIAIGLMFLTTLWLLYLQAFVLHAYCDYCLLSAALIFFLAGIVTATPRRA
jgi:uncharacterized membrane protein